MTNPELSQIRAHLEASAESILERNPSKKQIYDAYESIAIQILDSEHMDFPPGVLEQYLCNYLDELKARE